MANLTIKNIPESLYQKLKESSKQNRRSMNAEVIICLEEKLLANSPHSSINLDRIRRARASSYRHFLTDEDISLMKEEGR